MLGKLLYGEDIVFLVKRDDFAVMKSNNEVIKLLFLLSQSFSLNLLHPSHRIIESFFKLWWNIYICVYISVCVCINIKFAILSTFKYTNERPSLHWLCCAVSITIYFQDVFITLNFASIMYKLPTPSPWAACNFYSQEF